MRKVQEQAAHEALDRHADAGRRLRGSTSPADLIAMQAELMRSDFEGALRYWQGLTAASLEMQTELVSCTTQLVDSDAVMEGSAAVKAMPYEMPGLRALFNMVPHFINAAGGGLQTRSETS